MIDHQAVFNRAYALAKKGHARDKRKDKTTPYMVHVDAVFKRAEQIARQIEPTAVESIFFAISTVAVLHDLNEDHPKSYTWDRIFKELVGDSTDGETAAYVNEIIQALKAITKKPKGEEEYADYVTRVIQHIWARVVKLADLEHNMSDLEHGSLRDKYSLTLRVLKFGLPEYK